MPYANPKSPEAIVSQRRRCHRYYQRHYEDRIKKHRVEKLRTDPEWREKRRNINQNVAIKRRKQLINLLGGAKCLRCGFSDIRALCIDHIKGGGSEEVKKFKGNYKMYMYYLKNPEEAKLHLQVLCHNCNRIKQIENYEYNLSMRVENKCKS